MAKSVYDEVYARSMKDPQGNTYQVLGAGNYSTALKVSVVADSEDKEALEDLTSLVDKVEWSSIWATWGIYLETFSMEEEVDRKLEKVEMYRQRSICHLKKPSLEQSRILN